MNICKTIDMDCIQFACSEYMCKKSESNPCREHTYEERNKGREGDGEGWAWLLSGR